MARAIRRLRRMFLSLTRPLAELMRKCAPSKSNHTGATCGLPSCMMVARFAKAFLVSRSRNFSGMLTAMVPSFSKQLAGLTRMQVRAEAAPSKDLDDEPGLSQHFGDTIAFGGASPINFRQPMRVDAPGPSLCTRP